jgi:hypothetical protein
VPETGSESRPPQHLERTTNEETKTKPPFGFVNCPLFRTSAALRGPLRQYSRNIAESTPEKSWTVYNRWAVYKTGVETLEK